jgi:hypothetical protein
MLVLAHFTVQELPGTLSIWVAGIALGLALAWGDWSRLRVPLILMAAITAIGMLGERYGWAHPVQIALDIAFLGLAVLCVVLALARIRSHPIGRRYRPRAQPRGADG